MIHDFKNPDYTAIFAERQRRLIKLRANHQMLAALKTHYRNHPAQFITDWGCTFDPRNPERGLPSIVPFILFDKQIEWVEWFVDHWKTGRSGLTEKSRDAGVSWLTIATACTICMFNEGIVGGFGSRKEEYVDKIGSPHSLFDKARTFLNLLPREFSGTWEAPHMRVLFKDTGSSLTGESGDGIGRGARSSFYFVDEAAFLERPHLVEASLSQTTNCRMDVSTPNGANNPFAEKRRSGKVDVFTFHWRDDPRKGEEWYAKEKARLDPITLAQEVDINYSASVEGVLIPSEWVQAAIGAADKLMLSPSGVRKGALDVADEGKDANAFAGRFGVSLDVIEMWQGLGSDIMATVEKAFLLCDMNDYSSFDYDADGLGAGVRGDARIINERRDGSGEKQIAVNAFRGSEAVDKPEAQAIPGRKNKDMFANRKAQAWWMLRKRFQNTYRAVNDGIMPEDENELISINPKFPLLNQLVMELSQPTYSINGVGKILVDKQPDGTKSPNLADSVMIVYSSSNSLFSEKKKQNVVPVRQNYNHSQGWMR
jgi:hypothetical protein